jgi:hypothetical protein
MLPCIGIGIRICIDGWRMHLRYPSLGCSVRNDGNDGNDLMKIALNLCICDITPDQSLGPFR